MKSACVSTSQKIVARETMAGFTLPPSNLRRAFQTPAHSVEQFLQLLAVPDRVKLGLRVQAEQRFGEAFSLVEASLTSSFQIRAGSNALAAGKHSLKQQFRPWKIFILQTDGVARETPIRVAEAEHLLLSPIRHFSGAEFCRRAHFAVNLRFHELVIHAQRWGVIRCGQGRAHAKAVNSGPFGEQ